MSIVIKDYGVVTPFGTDPDSLWQKLTAGKSAVSVCKRFDVSRFECQSASILPATMEVDNSHSSVVWSLLAPLQEQILEWKCDHLILATTKGEIDLLERAVLENRYSSFGELPAEFTIDSFRRKMADYLSITSSVLISSACASSNSAIAAAAEMLLAGRAERVCVVGIDMVSKFVFSGFSALQALSSANCAKPFDSNRDGLIPGEACGALLLTCEDRRSERCGTVLGWGGASDANHVTGPSRDGSGLTAAVRKAMTVANITSDEIGAVSAHGTATLYNDAMEMHAFRTLFSDSIPVFSVKGALGHTMGASGVLETIISIHALKNESVPPTVGLDTPDELSRSWVSSESANFAESVILKTNSGFGGINAALLLGV